MNSRKHNFNFIMHLLMVKLFNALRSMLDFRVLNYYYF